MTAPVVLVDSNAKYSVVNKKVNATVNIAVEGDLNVTAKNIEFDLNTVGATVKSVAPLKTLDTSLTKIQTPVKTKATATKVTGYTITFELSKAGQFIFRVLDAKGGKVQHNATNGNKDTCSPLYTLTQTEYDKLIPPAQTTPSTPATQTVKPVLQYYKKSSSHYPMYEPVVRFPFELKDVTYTLTKNNIKVVTNNCGATYSLEKETNSTPAKGVAIRYNIVLSNIQKSGDFTYSVLDNAGKVITSNTNQTTDTFTVDLSKVFTASVMYNDLMFFTNAKEARTNFNIYGLNSDIQVKNIKIATNSTGATVSSVTRTDNGKSSNMRTYNIVFTGIKTDGAIGFYVLDAAGNTLAVVHSVNGDEISLPTRNPTLSDIQKYNIRVADVRSAHQVVYGSSPAYPQTKGQVTIPFTLKPSGTAPAFTASNVVVVTNGTGGTVSSVQSLGNNNYNIVLANVTRTGAFQYRLKDANGYTITPEGFKNSAGATHSTAASPAYSIDFSKVSDGLSTLKVTYDSAVTYPSDIGTAKLTFTVTDGLTTSSIKSAAKDLTSKTPAPVGGPVAGIPGTTIQLPTSLKMSNVDIRVNGTNATASLKHLGSGKYELLLTGVTRTGTFQFQLKDSDGNLIGYTNSSTVLSPAYTIDSSRVAQAKIRTAEKVVYGSENNAVVEKVSLTSEGGLVLKQENFTLVTNTCGAKILRLDRAGSSNNYTLVLSATKAGKFSFSVKVGSITPFVYTQKDTAKKMVNANVSMEYEVSVANGGTLQQKLELLEQIDSSKPAKTLDLNSMIQKGTGVNGALQLRDDSGNVYTLKDNPVSKDLQNARDKIEADGYLKADALKDKVIR